MEKKSGVDLASKIQKLPRPRAPERRVTATCSNADGGEELDHVGESFGEARAQVGGPKHRRFTTQEAQEPNNHIQRCGSQT